MAHTLRQDDVTVDIAQSNILILDSDLVNVLALKKSLMNNGFTSITHIKPSNELGSLLAKTNPDLVLFNLDLPDHNGFDLLEQLKRRFRNGEKTPIVVVTAQTDTELRKQALSLGACEFISVPANEIEILTRVKTLLTLRRKTLQLSEFDTQNAEQTTVLSRIRDLEKELLSCKKLEEKYRHLALHDHLTGLPNTKMLYERLESCLLANKQTKKPFALLLFSLEQFGEVTKTLGRFSGDYILKIAAERLTHIVERLSAADSRALDKSSCVLRYVGGKFAILLTELESENKAVSLAHQILSSMTMPYEIPDLVLEIGANIGIATSSSTSQDADSVIRKAEVALFKAKQDHQPVVVYSQGIDNYNAMRLALMAELRKAINQNSLSLVYQLQIDIKTHEICGVEALLRWTHPERGFISPAEFIPLAERSSIIKPLTVWVMNAAMQQVKEINQQGFNFSMAINISTSCLRDDTLVGYTKMLLNKHKIPPESMIMEVTESAMMQDPVLGLNLLNQLNRLGIQISIDDYGTGYSSLAYLKRLPLKEMKIDREFIKDIVSDEDDKLIVRTTIEMAHNFGLRVIAEGVEDLKTVELLRQMDCDQVQGFYFAKPMPAAQLVDWVHDYKRVPCNQAAKVQ